MRIDILTLFPDMFTGVFGNSILKRAVDKQLLELHTHDIRAYTTDKHHKADDYPFGGEAGMVMMIEPIARCIEQLQSERTYDGIYLMAPDGKQFNQQMANGMSMLNNIILLCGHYKGVDERVREMYITEDISIGLDAESVEHLLGTVAKTCGHGSLEVLKGWSLTCKCLHWMSLH